MTMYSMSIHVFNYIVIFFLTTVSVNLIAEESDLEVDASISGLKNEMITFNAVKTGMFLSMAYCKDTNSCLFAVTQKEIDELMNAVDERISILQKKDEEISSVSTIKESYISYLDDLKYIKDVLVQGVDLFAKSNENYDVEDIELLKLYEDNEKLEDDENSKEWF